MIKSNRLEILSILIMSLLLLLVGFSQSWSLSFSILNMCIISAIMSMGINMQWGYAGIFNVGIMGFTALGGLAAVLVSHAPIAEAWSAGGLGIMISFLILVLISLIVYWINRKLKTDKKKYWIITLVIIIGLIIVKLIYHPSVLAIEAVNPTLTGFFRRHGNANYILLDCWRFICCCGSICNWKNYVGTSIRLFSNCYLRDIRNYYCCFKI